MYWAGYERNWQTRASQMRTEVQIVVRRGALPRIRCHGGLQARITGPETVYLVSSAANPLGGDHIGVQLRVLDGARLTVRTVAAAVVLPGRLTSESTTVWDCEVDGLLDLDPAPTVVAADARHHSHIWVRGSTSSQLRLRERVQIGRTGESNGMWSGTIEADLDGSPLLRHRVEVGAGAVTDDELIRPRAIISELRYPAIQNAKPPPPDATLLQLAGGGTLMTWLGGRLPA